MTHSDAIDALLAQAAGADLPPPEERKRLRTAAKLTQAQVATALGVRRESVAGWEAGRMEPRQPHRAQYARLLSGLAAVRPLTPAPVEAPAAAPAPPAAPRPAKATTTATPRPRRHLAGMGVPDASERFPGGPLAVLAGGTTAFLASGQEVICPKSLPKALDWALDTAGLGAERLHRHGRDADPLLVLTAQAAADLGLPPELDRSGFATARLPESHRVVKGVLKAGWSLTRRGFGEWTRIYRPVGEDGKRRCVVVAVVPWGALDERTWGRTAEADPQTIARTLGAYAARVLTPCGSGATCGIELMTQVRPPTRAARTEDGSGWVSAPVSGSLTAPMDPAPPEAVPEHPAAAWGPEGPMEEEAYDWTRPVDLLTDAELSMPYAVGVDVNTAFLAAAGRLTVGLGEPQHRDRPRFDKGMPGTWLVDLSGIETDPRLPSPFTRTGRRPTGPGWYVTATVAYAQELGARVEPLEAWVRPTPGPYLDPWHKRLRDAYMATLAALGVTPDMDPAATLAAMRQLSSGDPAERAVLAAIKGTVKGGIGKMQQRGHGAKPGERWPALERPTWRPDIRAAVIATARTGMHRKMTRWAEHGLYPLGIVSDCAVYPSTGPSPLDLCPEPIPGGFRIGISPGMIKHEGTKEMDEVAGMLAKGINPARHIKN
ncbi:telomere-associated protein Tap [Streptomyces roseoverticillatus]|uniref:Helix-turn-helix transcriptional regulator n=1 Tax=Streptomyces roseoverticillatus TaxID=66429 RepID=A0ABV3J5V8_9ACTN